jgi:hypothetical protein
MGQKAKPLVDRIRESIVVDDATGCWVWQKSGQYGYGQIWVGSRVDGSRRRLLAHRASYMAFVSAIPDGMQLDHLCRNHGCVNPAHLEPVTCQENVRRGVAPPAVNAAKQSCKRGHPLEGDNIYVHGNKRYCRACRAIREVIRQAALR